MNNAAFKISFLYTFLFILLFSGLWIVYELYYAPLFSEASYEFYSLPVGEEMPSKLSLLIYPFKSIYHIIFALLVSFLIALAAKQLSILKPKHRRFRKIFVTSLKLTVLFGGLYLGSALLFDSLLAKKMCAGHGNIRLQLLAAMGLYLITSFLYVRSLSDEHQVLTFK